MIMVKTKKLFFLKIFWVDFCGLCTYPGTSLAISWYLHENAFFILNVIDLAIGIVVGKNIRQTKKNHSGIWAKL